MLMHPTLVLPRNPKTASADFSLHSHLTEGALGCFHLPYILPQLPDLGQPSLSFREKVVAGLLLSSPVPPALVVLRPVNLVLEAGADRRMTGQQLVVSADD